jgi:hypothetical protein
MRLGTGRLKHRAGHGRETEDVATPAPPVSADSITPTEVVVISELMCHQPRLFDLSMWTW